MDRQWKWLVLGGGSIGRRHVRNLRSLKQTDIAVFEPDGQRAEALSQECEVRLVDTLQQGLAMAPEAVMICSPTRFHLEQASACVAAGSALFIEKPLAHHWSGVEEFLHLVARANVPVLVGCNFRFHPGLRALHRLIKEGRFGPLVSLRAEFGYYLPYWHPWEDYRFGYSAQQKLGGGVALDRIHEFDLLRWLGGDFVSVQGRCRKTGLLEIDTEDVVQAEVHYSSGAWGTLHVDYLRRSYRCIVEVLGTEGYATWDYSQAKLVWYDQDSQEEQARRWPTWEPNQMYLEELKHFMEVLSGSVLPEQDAASSAEILKAVLKVKQSIEGTRI